MRHLAILLVSVGLAACAVTPFKAPTLPEPELPAVDIPYQKFVLDNGLTLIVHEDHKTPIVAVNVWYHVGSKNEAQGRTGFAHLFEHLMFNGSENYNDEFFKPLESIGATSMNGTTNADRTNYFANVPTPALDRLLWMESDRMGHLLGAIDQDRLDEQRDVVKNEKRQREGQPYGRVWDAIAPNAYPAGHPYSWTTIGSMADLDAATLDDVRGWFEDWYGAANAVIVVAGDVTAEHALERVQHYFGDIPAGPPRTRARAWPAPMPDDRRIEIADRVPQARVHLIWNLPPNFSRDLVDMDLLADVLANGKTSRLYQRLVYRDQTATDVGAYILPRELGSQLIVWVTAKPGVEVEGLEQAALEEIERLRSLGPWADELARIKTRTYAGYVRGLERVGGFGGKSDVLASSAVYTGNPEAYKDELEWMRSADPKRVQRTAERWLGHGHLTVTVLPQAQTRTAATGADRSHLPAVGSAPALQLPPLQRTTLSNGLKVVLAEQHAAPVVQLKLLADGGYSRDPRDRLGLAQLTMSMLDEGTQNRDALTIADDLERLGSTLGSGASLDHVAVSMSSLTTTLPQSAALFADVITRPTFPQTELERLRGLQLAGIEQELVDPFKMGLRTLPPLLYGSEHPYGVSFTGSGTAATVQAITQTDLQDYYHRWVRPDSATLLVVGDTSLDAITPILEEAFGGWRPVGEPAAAPLPDVPPAQGSRVFLINKPHAEQTLMLAGALVPPPGGDEDVAMETANTLFGGMFTSRLNLNLREDKHWTYGARSALLDARGQRPVLIYAKVERDHTADAIRETRREMNNIHYSGRISEAEMTAARDSMIRGLPGRNETSGQIAGSISHILNFDLPDDYYAQYVEDVKAQTPRSVARAALTSLDQRALTWVIVGDLSVIRPQVDALELGPVTVLDAPL